MINKVHLFSVGDQHTTAIYLERALIADKIEYLYWKTLPDLSVIEEHDLFLFIDPAPDWPLGLEKLPCITAAYFIDVHQDIESRLCLAWFFDLIFVAQKEYLHTFLIHGHRSAHWLPLACDPEIHNQPNEEKIYEVGFVGKMGLAGSWRHDTLTAVLPHYRTNGYRQFYPPGEFGKIYGQSKIVFNASINKDLNMRFFEALASGALLITDRIPDALGDLLIEGLHFVGYTDIKEARERIDYYLRNENERHKIATTGQQSALTAHTYLHRWQSIKAIAGQCEKISLAREADRSTLRRMYTEVFVHLRRPRRILDVIAKYGSTHRELGLLLKATARWLNARVPLTPNAIRARLKAS